MSTDKYVPPEPRWELQTDNVLSTNLFETLVPGLPRRIERIAEHEVAFHKLLKEFLPHNRREELLEYERDLREKQVGAWRFLHDWVLDGLHQFVSESKRLLDAVQSRRRRDPRQVYEHATITGDRCQCARAYTSSLVDVWKGMREVIEYYSQRPIPMSKGEDSNLQAFFKIPWSLYDWFRGAPMHTSPEDYQKLIELSDKIHLEWKEIHTSLDDLAQFFNQLSELYLKDGMTEEWAASLDVKRLRESWGRMEGEIESGKRAVIKCQNRISRLEVPLMR